MWLLLNIQSMHVKLDTQLKYKVIKYRTIPLSLSIAVGPTLGEAMLEAFISSQTKQSMCIQQLNVNTDDAKYFLKSTQNNMIIHMRIVQLIPTLFCSEYQ